MKKILAAVLTLVMLAVFAAAFADDEVKFDDGTLYQVRVVDTDRIEAEQVLTLEMYGISVIQEEQIQSIRPGTLVTMEGQTVTAKELIRHGEDTYELLIEEDTFESVVFERMVMNYFGIWINDCQACGDPKGILTVALPMDDDFIMVWKGVEETDDVTYTGEEFIRFVLEDGASFNQYNTSVKLLNGRPCEITHSDYPPGLGIETPAE